MIFFAKVFIFLQTIKYKVWNISYFRLIDSLEEKGRKVNEDLAYIERVQAQIEGLNSELLGLQSETERLYVFGEDQKAAEDSLNVCKFILCMRGLCVCA